MNIDHAFYQDNYMRMQRVLKLISGCNLFDSFFDMLTILPGRYIAISFAPGI